MQAPCSVFLEFPALKASTLLLQYILQRPGNGLYRALDLYISCTTPLRAPPVELFFPASNFAFQGKDSATVHGSAELLDSNLASVFHAVSLQYPRSLPES